MKALRIIGLFALLQLVLTPLSGQSSKPDSFERQFLEYGLVNIRDLDSTIRVRLAYASTDNFLGKNVYGNLSDAYFAPHFARQVVIAQRALKKIHPDYSLLILDASRPLSVQKEMYALVRGTPLSVYVASGNKGGRHNYGVAIDLTIVDKDGNELDMGTPFDHFGEASHLGDESRWIEEGSMKPEGLKNRQLLQSVMRTAGLIPYRKEWWHFQERESMEDVREKYFLLDF